MKNPVIILSAFILFGIAACSGNKSETSKVSKENVSQAATSEMISISVGLNIGQRAPELEYPSPDGELLKLSDLRGKIVLIDFWAGWCGPCRMENPNIVKTWKEYSDKEFTRGSGFDIYSVSLDKTKEGWLKAISDDGLDWDHHVSDLKYWNSVPAAMYQVRGIPASWLIDGNGIIIDKNLRGEALGARLNSLLK